MIKAAIVGTGNIANLHMQGLLTFPEQVKVVALCDIYPEKAEDMKKRYDLKDARVYENIDRMLAEEEAIDLVHICTPPFVHAPLAIKAMEHHCNVIVEKPMATCIRECDEMIAAAEQNGVLLSPIAQNRFRNPIWKLKKTIESGLLGKVCFAEINSLWWRGACYYDLWWRGTWEKEGGGPTLNHAVHHIDMLNWIMEEEPTQVVSMMSNVCHPNSEVEDISVGCVKYANRSLGRITSSVIHHGEEQGLSMQCEFGKIDAPFDIKAEVTMENGFPVSGGNKELVEKVKAFYEKIPDLPYEGHTGQIRDVLEALQENRKPYIQGKDGKRTVEVITALYKAAFLEKTVSFPITKEDAFYEFEGILKHAVRFNKKGKSVENFTEQRITVGNYQ
ncbi:MAG: Gfo/Idh/MocA family oxidoreductase [Lachnospiraceae bacterium]|nr:Gfo/Idh/MocA family oxidoreductase [Lachnospiraceae bacterium]